MVTVKGEPDVNSYRQTPDDMYSLRKPILKKLLHNETKKRFLINSKVVFFSNRVGETIQSWEKKLLTQVRWENEYINVY